MAGQQWNEARPAGTKGAAEVGGDGTNVIPLIHVDDVACGGTKEWFDAVQARPFLDGQSRNIELGMIGRRVAETEWELLNLMEGKAL